MGSTGLDGFYSIYQRSIFPGRLWPTPSYCQRTQKDMRNPERTQTRPGVISSFPVAPLLVMKGRIMPSSLTHSGSVFARNRTVVIPGRDLPHECPLLQDSRDQLGEREGAGKANGTGESYVKWAQESPGALRHPPRKLPHSFQLLGKNIYIYTYNILVQYTHIYIYISIYIYIYMETRPNNARRPKAGVVLVLLLGAMRSLNAPPMLILTARGPAAFLGCVLKSSAPGPEDRKDREVPYRASLQREVMSFFSFVLFMFSSVCLGGGGCGLRRGSRIGQPSISNSPVEGWFGLEHWGVPPPPNPVFPTPSLFCLPPVWPMKNLNSLKGMNK